MVDLNINGVVSADLSGLKGDKGDPGIVNIVQLESSTELVANLDIFSQTKVPVYALQLPDLKANAILSVSAQFECTKTGNYNVMLGRYLNLKNSVLGINLTKPCTDNITVNGHHRVVNIARQCVIASDMAAPTLALIAYAGASSAVSGSKLVVEKGYGHLDVLIINN